VDAAVASNSACLAHVNTSNQELAEAKAILLGLKLAAARQDASCVVASDAKSSAHCSTHRAVSTPWRAAHVVN